MRESTYFQRLLLKLKNKKNEDLFSLPESEIQLMKKLKEYVEQKVPQILPHLNENEKRLLMVSWDKEFTEMLPEKIKKQAQELFKKQQDQDI